MSLWVTACTMGALMNVAFAPMGFFPAAFFSLGWLYSVIESEKSLSRLFRITWLFWGFFLSTGFNWIAKAISADFYQFWYMIPFVTVGLGMFLGALPAGMLVMAKSCCIVDCRMRMFLYAFAVTIGEWLISRIFGGFPWLSVGYIWSGSQSMLQVTSLFGIYVLGMITILCSFMLSLGWSKRNYRTMVVPISLMIIMFSWGFYRIEEADKLGYVTGVMLRVVQPNISQVNKWNEVEAVGIIRKNIALTAAAGAENITHVIWPEAAVPFILSNKAVNLLEYMSSVINGYLITGALRWGAKDLMNSLFVIDSAGSIVAHYDKMNLVPYAEYVPFSSVLPLEKLVAFKGSFGAGSSRKAINLLKGPPFLPLICYEVIFSGRITKADSVSARWIVNITNDAWFGVSAAPFQHLLIARVRAIEEGMPLVRSANSGISAVFDSYGGINGHIALNQEGILDTQLPNAIENFTIFSKISGYIELFFLFGAVAMIIFSLIRSRFIK